jgi:hypothetical protein
MDVAIIKNAYELLIAFLSTLSYIMVFFCQTLRMSKYFWQPIKENTLLQISIMNALALTLSMNPALLFPIKVIIINLEYVFFRLKAESCASDPSNIPRIVQSHQVRLEHERMIGKCWHYANEN